MHVSCHLKSWLMNKEEERPLHSPRAVQQLLYAKRDHCTALGVQQLS